MLHRSCLRVSAQRQSTLRMWIVRVSTSSSTYTTTRNNVEIARDVISLLTGGACRTCVRPHPLVTRSPCFRAWNVYVRLSLLETHSRLPHANVCFSSADLDRSTQLLSRVLASITTRTSRGKPPAAAITAECSPSGRSAAGRIRLVSARAARTSRTVRSTPSRRTAKDDARTAASRVSPSAARSRAIRAACSGTTRAAVKSASCASSSLLGFLWAVPMRGRVLDFPPCERGGRVGWAAVRRREFSQ